ncbi:CinA family protein [Photobacterium atrarenae]|uniref:Nicotinamide-nucleotide amidohydrolase family protein n=1 Tax=Photobacterium atrarenae TaxID=865757 RepID=A0ABY5GG94_9GAMM|nr:nicotinamide-nucleotide amidohydrolase family protein [Photobacterium atrarenae]UTV28201.1 nicotinamide-nucleotide amidohydrolase family protein [Photobacterium atrarenae]
MAEVAQLARELGEALSRQGWMATTAESCTGGGVSMAITEIAGSSVWFDRAFVTYSNEAKQQMLGVAAATLAEHGAVSEAVAAEMATGALVHSDASISVSVSGIAGPGGGSVLKPVGTVCFSWADRTGWTASETCHFAGDRQAVRTQAIEKALCGLLHRLQQMP